MKPFILSLSMLCASLCTSAQTLSNHDITAVPEGLGLPDYYTKYAKAGGMHVLASDKAPDSCMVRVCEQIDAIVGALSSDVKNALAQKQIRVIVMGRYEGITQLPEFKDYPGMEPYWDIHKRGWGADRDMPVMLCAEENVLAYQIDPNYAEDVLVSSMAKTIFSLGINEVNPGAEKQLADLYNNAKVAGKWQNTTAATSLLEYWAEGVQDWFDVNAEAPLPDGAHNWVNTREDLRRYDTPLYDFIGRYISADTKFVSRHPKVNLYKKDDKKAYAKMHKEKKLNIDVPACTVEAVSASLAERLNLDTSFYKKYVNSNGIHILSSDQVPDACLEQAHKTIYCMTSMLPREVLDAMTRVNTRVVIMGQKEVTIQVPEHRNLAHDRSMNWNLRARGLGGTLREPITSCAEENVMAYAWDKYHAEDILIHEFSHSIHLIGILQVDPTINQQLKDLLEKALAEGKWHDTYAGSVFEEYWAEGVQNWFNVNAETPQPDTKHNQINTREELRRYDPGLYALIAKYFPETNAQIGKHKKENLYNWK